MRSLFTTIILVAVSFMAVSHQALASDANNVEDLTNLSIEELLKVEVISASRLGQKANQAPTSLSVLTASDIRTFGWRTLADALNAMRGLYTINDRNYTYLGVRGFWHPNDYNSRVLLMIDGQRMNENIFDGSYMGQEFMLDTDLIERIEFIPGSGSSIYGANAFLGLINVVTKTGNAINGAQLSGEAGSYDTYKGRISYGKTLANGADVLVSASHYDSAGVPNLYFPEFDTPNTNHGIAHNLDAERADRLFARVQFKNFTLTSAYVDRYKQVPTASFGALFNDPDFFTDDRRFFGNLKYQTALSDKTSIQVKGFYQAYDYYADEAYNNGGRVVNHDAASGRWWGGEAQLNSTYFNGHRLILGLEYQYDQRQRLENYDLAPYTLYQDTDRQGHRVELYAQDDIQVLKTLIFSAGLRLDYHHMLKNLQLNPRLGLIWNPWTSTTVKFLYSSTFRAPNVWERDYSAGANNLANPDNYEEQLKSYEGIIEWRSPTGLKLTGNVFLNDITQLLEQESFPVYGVYGQFLNIDKYQVFGIELEAERRWNSGRFVKASYTYSRMTDLIEGGKWSEGSPQQIFKLHYAEPLFNNYASLGVENIYIGDRKALQGGFADAYDQINLNISSDRILRGSLLSFGVYDLLDTHYQMLGGAGYYDIRQNILPMNGREFRLKLQFTF